MKVATLSVLTNTVSIWNLSPITAISSQSDLCFERYLGTQVLAGGLGAHLAGEGEWAGEREVR